jgi:hypothetical protein
MLRMPILLRDRVLGMTFTFVITHNVQLQVELEVRTPSEVNRFRGIMIPRCLQEFMPPVKTAGPNCLRRNVFGPVYPGN